MRYTWDRAFADGREAALVGEGPQRLLDACAQLMPADGTYASVGVEAPLLGAPGYDMLITFPGSELPPAGLPADPHAQAVRDVFAWNAGLGKPRPTLYVEVDHGNPAAVAGIHCKVEHRRELVEGFFAAMGDSWRIQPYLDVAARLPQDWICLYAAAFPGRAESLTRLEVLVMRGDVRACMADAGFVGKCLDQVGFAAYDAQMLEDIARLAAIDVPLALQFDIACDGSLAPTLAVVSNYEHVRLAWRPLFDEDGELARTCGIYQDMDVCDGRWRLLEQGCLARRRTLLTAQGVRTMDCRVLPDCTKAKWLEARRLPARFYLRMGQRWL